MNLQVLRLVKSEKKRDSNTKASDAKVQRNTTHVLVVRITATQLKYSAT